MFLTLRIPWIMINLASGQPQPVLVPAGTYAVERVERHLDDGQQEWLMLAGTQTGLSRIFAEEMASIKFGDFQLDVQPDTLTKYPKND
ncbi:MAG: hypothetical protein HY975_03190 [Candidatus Kerfeldbacteria bacterium]|nr:hypothetical protein [Candidatus Kerfeldbacteria bacterium]